VTSFKKIQYFSKTNPQSLFNFITDFSSRYNKISNLYFNDINFTNSCNYGTFRQHNYISSKSLNNNFYTKIDNKNLNKYLNYNYSIDKKDLNVIPDMSSINTYSRKSNLNSSIKLNEILNVFNYKNDLLKSYLQYPIKTTLLGSENDSKQVNNTIKYNLNLKFTKKNLLGKDYLSEYVDSTELNTNLVLNNLTSYLQNKNLTYRFRDVKSNNLSFLANEKNIRLVDNVSLKKSNHNLTTSQNNLDELISSNITKNINNNLIGLYSNSNLN
jgi:hypothetical protein